MFEDFGTASVSAGRARVSLDPTFAETIDAGDYHVFLTPRGDSRGLYVTAQDAWGFEIREQQGGTSTLQVSYRVVAQRKGLAPAHRLETLNPDKLTPPKVADTVDLPARPATDGAPTAPRSMPAPTP